MIQFENAVVKYEKLILGEMKKQGIRCWLAGGAIRDYFMSVPVTTDYDMFFPDEINYNKARAYFISLDHEIKWESENGCKIEVKKITFDLVKKYFKNPQETIDAFDFTASMFAVDSEKVYFGESSFIDISKKQLMINKITYLASSLMRAFRYHKKGFSICKGECKKLFDAIQESKPRITPLDIITQANVQLTPTNMTSGELENFFLGID